MALAGGGHVLVTVGADLDRAVPLPGGHRGDGGEEVHLAFLAAEAAAHAPDIHHHGVGGHAKYVGDHVLRFAGVLGGAMHHHVVILSGDGKGDLPLQVHVILPAHVHPPGDAMRGGGEAGFEVAALQLEGGGDMGVARLLRCDQVERVGQRLAIHAGQRRRAAGDLAGLGDDGEERLAVELDQIGREDRLVVLACRADVIRAGDVGGGEHAGDARAGQHLCQVEALQSRVGDIRHAEIGVQRALGLGDIVRVVGAAGDVLGGAVVDMVHMGRAGDGGYVLHGRVLPRLTRIPVARARRCRRHARGGSGAAGSARQASGSPPRRASRSGV